MEHWVIFRQSVTTEHVVVQAGLVRSDPRSAMGVRETTPYRACAERVGVCVRHTAPREGVEWEQYSSSHQIESRFPLGIGGGWECSDDLPSGEGCLAHAD